MQAAYGYFFQGAITTLDQKDTSFDLVWGKFFEVSEKPRPRMKLASEYEPFVKKLNALSHNW
jgi:hypothetical protein